MITITIAYCAQNMPAQLILIFILEYPHALYTRVGRNAIWTD